MNTPYIHPTAIIEAGVEIGPDTYIWDGVHISRNSHVGASCVIGGKTNISHDVRIGDMVKISSFVDICNAVTLEDGVMISAGCIFTNDRYPRAAEPELMSLRSNGPEERTLPTLVRAGASIGAGSIIGCNLSIGRFAMVGMGSMVTRPVDEFHLVVGRPARTVGYVCRCGQPFAKFEPGQFPDKLSYSCAVCRRRYNARNGVVSESFAVFATGR